MQYSNKSGKGRSLSIGLSIGTLVCMGIILTGAALVAQLMQKEILKEEIMGYAVLILMIAGSYFGRLTAVNRVGNNRLITSLALGLIVFAILLGITAFMFDGQYLGVGVNSLLVLCGCGLSAFPRKKKKSGLRRYKY